MGDRFVICTLVLDLASVDSAMAVIRVFVNEY